MVDWAFATFLLAVLSLPLLYPYWDRYVFRTLRSVFRLSSARKCMRLQWKDVYQAPGPMQPPIHDCQNRVCQHALMDVKSLFNRNLSRHNRYCEKPTMLPLDKEFICVDMNIIKAWMLSTISSKFRPIAVSKREKKSFNDSSCSINVSRFKGTGPFVCRMEGTYLRPFSKQELQLLIDGYPPYYREEYQPGQGPLHANYLEAIPTDADIARAGWIIAVGLFMNTPVPIYVDNVQYANKDTGIPYPRGGMFYRSFQRTITVLENAIKPAFPQERVIIEEVIQSIKYMVKNETESGVNEPQWGRIEVLRSNQCTAAFRVFNGSPDNLTPEERERVRHLEPILRAILKAAFDGVKECIRYMKNPGRELGVLIPSNLDEDELFYVEIS